MHEQHAVHVQTEAKVCAPKNAVELSTRLKCLRDSFSMNRQNGQLWGNGGGGRVF